MKAFPIPNYVRYGLGNGWIATDLNGIEASFEKEGRDGEHYLEFEDNEHREHVAVALILVVARILSQAHDSAISRSELKAMLENEGVLDPENEGVFNEGMKAPKRGMKEGKEGKEGEEGEGKIKTTSQPHSSHLYDGVKATLLQGGIGSDWVRYFDCMTGYARALNNPYDGDSVGLAMSFMKKPGTEKRFRQWLRNHPEDKA